MTKQYRIRIASRPKSGEQIGKDWSAATTLVKEMMGVCNNAAWLICLDARDKLMALPNWEQQVSGGRTVEQSFKRVFNAFHAYERNLIYDDYHGFFDLKGMTENVRRRYGDISNREYYDFWAATGSATYTRMKPFVTSLWNKYRLALIHGGIPDKRAEICAWGLAGVACLNTAVNIHRITLDMISDEYHISRALLERHYKCFSLSDIAKLWEDALLDAMSKEYHTPISDTDSENINMGLGQIYDSWIQGDKIYDDMEKTLEECGEDVMKSKGFIKKAIAEVRQLKQWHYEAE